MRASTLKSKRDLSVQEIVADAMLLKTPKLHTSRRLFENATQHMDQAVKFTEDLRHFTRCTVGADFNVERPFFRAELATLYYDEALAEVLAIFEEYRFKTASAFEGVLNSAVKDKRIGLFEELSEDAGRFSYIETETAQKGVFRNRLHDHAVTHDLVQMRKKRIASYGDGIPEHAQHVIALMPEPLRRNAWIISGFRVLEEREFVRSRTELTALGRKAKSAQESVASAGRSFGGFMNRHGKAVGIGAGILAAVTLAAVAAPAMLAIGAVHAVAADPAVVVGKFVFAGWE